MSSTPHRLIMRHGMHLKVSVLETEADTPDTAATAADSVEIEETTSVDPVVATEVETILDLSMVTILREAVKEEVDIEADFPGVATLLPKSDKICG